MHRGRRGNRSGRVSPHIHYPIRRYPYYGPFPVVPLPIPVPVYTQRESPIQREHDVNFRLLNGNLYIVTSPYLMNHVFSKIGDSFVLVGISPTGDLNGIRYFTSEEIDRIGVKVI